MARVKQNFWQILSLILIELAILLVYIFVMDKGIVPYKYDSFSTIALELFCLFVFIAINRFVFKQPIFHSTKIFIEIFSYYCQLIYIFYMEFSLCLKTMSCPAI